MAEQEARPEIVRPTFQFRKLSIKEKRKFRAWARENYEPYTAIDGTWHPVIQAECVKVNDELATYTMEPVEDPYCPECGFMWSTHNDDGSCVED
ncbi:MAG: hypothetical protein ACYSW0_18675 [Planctomycetota bacterium]